MMSLVEACKDPAYPAEVAVVISNRPDVGGFELAQAEGVRADVVDHKTFEGREPFEEAMNEILDKAKVDLVVNAGFMRIVTEGFVSKWLGRNINIHPSLLPAFPGIHVHEQVLEAGVTVSGCTVHFVTEELDGGPIIGQAEVPVMPNDTPNSLAARVLAEEHKLLPECVRMIAIGDVSYGNRKARSNTS